MHKINDCDDNVSDLLWLFIADCLENQEHTQVCMHTHTHTNTNRNTPPMMVLMSEACPGQSTRVNWTLSNPFPARWLGTGTEKEENPVETRGEKEYGRGG